jgi:hypothetical protein
MHVAALLPLRTTAAASTVTVVELGLAALAVVLFVALLMVRAKRDHDQKIRKAGSVGYYDPDAARYGHGSVAPAPADATVDAANVPLAPTFVAPGRKTSTRRRGPAPVAPRPVPSSFGVFRGEPPRPVPAFDPVEAVRARPLNAEVPVAPMAEPPSRSGPPPLPPPPPPPPGVPLLPRLDRPPPPGEAPTSGRWTPA